MRHGSDESKPGSGLSCPSMLRLEYMQAAEPPLACSPLRRSYSARLLLYCAYMQLVTLHGFYWVVTW